MALQGALFRARHPPFGGPDQRLLFASQRLYDMSKLLNSAPIITRITRSRQYICEKFLKLFSEPCKNAFKAPILC
jgi:hypothetical protein